MKDHPYTQTEFLKSAPDPSHAPLDQGREVAFAGRSNAGKSSALNAITGHKSLARTSKTPGRTQLINFFSITSETRLVDLPGYGYAKVSKQTKAQWQHSLADYLAVRNSLQGLILLMDIRHPLTDYDQQLLIWCHEHGVPVHALLTKADKLKYGAAKSALLQVQKGLENLCPEASVQLFSSLKKTGLDDARAQLDIWLGLKESATDNDA